MAYTVKIQPSGHEFAVEQGETVLDAALREGCALPYGCRNGACGTCKGRLLKGRVRYDDGQPSGLSEEEEAAGFALFCQARPETDLEIEVKEIGAGKDIIIKTLPVRVARMERLAPDVMRLYLKLPAAERLQFLAGQYIDILLRDGGRRGFSIANAPHDDEYIELHVRRYPGGRFTGYVFSEMKPKTLLRIEGPLGSFFLREDSDRPVILVGGGTGFAPLKGILEHAFHTGVRRPMHLYWGARARPDLYLHDLPLGWEREYANFRYTPVLSEPEPEERWEGRTGLVIDTVLQDYRDLSGHDVYMAGPPAMIKAAREAFAERGLPGDRLFYDAFEIAARPGDRAEESA